MEENNETKRQESEEIHLNRWLRSRNRTKHENERPAAEEPPDSPREVRLRGLLMFVGGILLTPVWLILDYYVVLLLASLFGESNFGFGLYLTRGLIAMPLVVSFVGCLELVSGVSFRRLQTIFAKGGEGLVGILLLVAVSVIVSVVAVIGAVICFYIFAGLLGGI